MSDRFAAREACPVDGTCHRLCRKAPLKWCADDSPHALSGHVPKAVEAPPVNLGSGGMTVSTDRSQRRGSGAVAAANSQAEPQVATVLPDVTPMRRSGASRQPDGLADQSCGLSAAPADLGGERSCERFPGSWAEVPVFYWHWQGHNSSPRSFSRRPRRPCTSTTAKPASAQCRDVGLQRVAQAQAGRRADRGPLLQQV